MKNKSLTSVGSSLIPLLFLFFLTSCKSGANIPGTDIPITGQIALKTLQPPKGKALVYIVRHKSMGMLARLYLEIDKQVIGQTKGRQFLYTFLDPGKHLIISRGEKASVLPVELEAGKTYFFHQQPKMGLITIRSKLTRMEEEEAKRYLSYCRLSKSNITFEGF